MTTVLRKYLPFLLASVITLFLLTTTIAYADEASAFAKGIQSVLWSIVNSVFGWLTGLGGLILDYAISDFVVGFGDQFLNKGVGSAVDDLWVGVRDIFNLTFVFGLVWIGFKMILNSDDSNTRRWLISLIMAALLVNFSLFITKFVVDFSNILATEIVNSGFGTTDVSGVFMQIIGLPTVWENPSVANNTSTLDGAQNGYGYIFGAMFIFLIAAFVFAAGGLMLIIRFIALSLYMVLSPLMFLGWVFPQMQGITSQYWRGFLGRAFYAPVYLLLIFFAATIVDNLVVSMGTGNFGAVLGGDGAAVTSGFASSFIPFILACGFLIAAIVVGGKMSADGASTVIRVGNNINGRIKRGAQRAATRTARGAARPVTAGAGMAGRRTSYALGSGLDRSIERMQNADKNTRTGKAMRRIGRSVAVDDTMRGGAANLKSQKFGLNNTIDEENKKRGIIDKRVAGNDALKAGLAAEQLKAGGENIVDPTTGKVVKRSDLSAENLKKAEEAQEKMIADMQSTVNNYSTKQLEEMMQNQPEQFEGIIGKLKAGQFDKLIDSDNINSQQKDQIYQKRVESIKKSLGQTINQSGEAVGEIMSDKLKDLSIKQIETLGDEFIRENADMLTQSQMDDIKKSDSFTESQKGSYIGARKTNQIKNAESTDPNVRKRLFENSKWNPETKEVEYARKKPTEIANLPFEAYINEGTANSNTIAELNASELEEIFNKKTLNADQRGQLAEQIKKNGSESAKNYLNTPLGQRNWGGAEKVSPTPEAAGSASASKNPFNRLGSAAEANRHYEWEKQNGNQ